MMNETQSTVESAKAARLQVKAAGGGYVVSWRASGSPRRTSVRLHSWQAACAWVRTDFAVELGTPVALWKA